MLGEYLQALLLIFIAEMGDKTQILAMLFATQYKVRKVIIGVFIGSLLNHGLAVALGSYLSNVIPIHAIQILAGFCFIGFALWTLKEEGEEEDAEGVKRFGPVITVAMAFFIGELGDKTQLAAITLAVDASYPVIILMGTVTGMILTSGMGIFVGSKIGDRIPEFALKIGSAVLFLFFGTIKLYDSVPAAFISAGTVTVFFLVVGVSAYLLLKPTLDARKIGRKTPLQTAAHTLYEYTHQIKESVDNVCLGEANCGKCEESKCIIGYVKYLIDQVSKENEFALPEGLETPEEFVKRHFEDGKVVESLGLTLGCLERYGRHYDENFVIDHIRQALEIILFQEVLQFDGDMDKYIEQMSAKNEKIARKVAHALKKTNEM